MENKEKYVLRVLPIFEKDLNEIIDYIAFTLENPIAAESFLHDLENAVMERLPFAEAFEPYHSARERKHPYYRIFVKNYTVFYVVIGNTMELRRILYSRRPWEKMI